MTFKEKISLAKDNNIIIPSNLADKENIVGVYKIFTSIFFYYLSISPQMLEYPVFTDFF